MKKKLLILLLTVVAALCCALCFAACGDNSGNGGETNQTQQGGGNQTPGGSQTETPGGGSSTTPGENNPTPTPPEHTHEFSNVWSSDEVNHWHAATCGHTDKQDEAPHTYVNGVCSTCNHAHENHNYGNYTADDSNHTHTCTVCQKSESALHTYVNGVCSTCNHSHENHSYGSYTADDSTHTHTCTVCKKSESGAHTYVNGVCSTCNHAHEEHSFDNWVDKKQPNCTEDGYKEHTCSVCGKTEQQPLTHSGHNYQNGVCQTCGDVQGYIAFKNLQLNDDTAYGKVPANTEYFSFIDEILYADGVTYDVYTSRDCKPESEIPSATPELKIGDNTFYILARKGNDRKLYTVTVRRRPVYTVNFVTDGSAVDSQSVEEDQNIVQPAATEKTGYTFQNWTLNGNVVTFPYLVEEEIPQTSNYTVNLNAVFAANGYKVTLNAAGGDLTENEQPVTFDESYNFPVPTRTGYTFLGWFEGENQFTNAEGASLENWTGTTDTTLYAKWQVNQYTVTLNKNLSAGGSVSGGGDYAYDSQVTITASTNNGYTFVGWYKETEQVSTELSYQFKMGLDVTYTAKWQMLPEMENFDFTSTTTTCSVSGIKDKTVKEIIVPDYVTEIKSGTFKGCSKVESITLPFVGDSIKSSTDKYQYPFGYIFGTTSYSGASAVEQNYYGNSTSSTTNSTYYIPNSLKSVTITGGNILYGAFYNCTSLTSITLPNSVTSIGSYAFCNCKANIEWGDNPLITGIGNYAFSGYKGASITIPDSVTSIGHQAFKGCTSLESITIPDSVTSIGYHAFYDCANLTGVYITDLKAWCNIEFGYYDANPLYYVHNLYLNNNLVTEITADMLQGVTEIKDYTFQGCTSLISISIPDSITSIGERAFEDCTNLTGVYITDLKAWCNISFNYSVANPLCYAHNLYLNDNLVTNITADMLQGVKEIKDYAFWSCTSLESISIPDSVTSIGYDAFYNCSSLESVTIGNSVTSIGNYAFYKCTSLASVTIPNSVTSIGGSVFSGCTSLASVTIPNSVTSIGGSAFEDCIGLTSVTIGNGVTSIGGSVFEDCTAEIKWGDNPSIQKIGDYAFSGYKGTSITIPDSVTSIGEKAFYNCTNLTGVYITDLKAWCNISFNYSSDNPLHYAHNLYLNNELVTEITAEMLRGVTGIKFATFWNCTSLESIEIPDSVTSIGKSALHGCTSLKSITLPFVGGSKNATTASSSTLFGYVFGTSSYTGSTATEQYYSILSNNYVTYYIPNSLKSVTITGDKILYGAFYNCTSLTSITIGNGVTSIGEKAFYNCTSLGTAYWNAANCKTAGSSSDPIFGGCTALTNVYIGENVGSIPYDAFSGCTSLKGVYITDIAAWCDIEFGNIYANPLYYAHNLYLNDEFVTNITADKLQGVTGIKFVAFYNCTSLESVTIGNGVTSIGDGAFCNCTSLTSITIGNGVTSIGGRAFYNCTSLGTVYWNAINCETAGSSSNPFFGGCTALTNVYIGENVGSIPDYAFYECTNLMGVYITDLKAWCNIEFDYSYNESGAISANPLYYAHNLYLNDNLVTNITAEMLQGVTEIKFATFYNCTSLKSITIPDSVTSIGDSAFSHCTNLESITIGNGVTSIGDSAFRDCTAEIKWGDNPSIKKISNFAFREYKGTSITIPDSVTSIGMEAFSYCTSLTSIIIPDSVTSIGGYAFYECTSLATVYYGGNQAQWNSITIGNYNGKLENATRYYFSETEPDEAKWAESKNWWHYDPVTGELDIWEKD